MRWIALVGPELEENLSLRYLARRLAAAGFESRILAFNSDARLRVRARARSSRADEPPLAVGLSLAFQWRAPDFLALAVALREAGYRGHITAGGHFATFAGGGAAARLPRARLDLPPGEPRRRSSRSAARWPTGAPWPSSPAWSPRDDGGGAVPHRAAGAARSARRCPGPIAAASRRAASATASRRSCRAAAATPTAPSAASPPGTSRRCRASATACASSRTSPTRWPRMQRERGIEIFVFHDDNFFVPGHGKNLSASERARRCARGAGHARLRDGGEGAPDRRHAGGVPASSSSACTASAATSASRPTPTRG